MFHHPTKKCRYAGENKEPILIFRNTTYFETTSRKFALAAFEDIDLIGLILHVLRNYVKLVAGYTEMWEWRDVIIIIMCVTIEEEYIYVIRARSL